MLFKSVPCRKSKHLLFEFTQFHIILYLFYGMNGLSYQSDFSCSVVGN